MALMGKCDACLSRAEEIKFLREQVMSLQRINAELASPLINARIAAADRKPREVNPDAKPPNRASAQMLRLTREDRPPERAVPPAEDVEASFQRKG